MGVSDVAREAFNQEKTASLEIPPKEEVTRIEIWGAWWPFLTTDCSSAHHSSVKLLVKETKIHVHGVANTVI